MKIEIETTNLAQLIKLFSPFVEPYEMGTLDSEIEEQYLKENYDLANALFIIEDEGSIVIAQNKTRPNIALIDIEFYEQLRTAQYLFQFLSNLGWVVLTYEQGYKINLYT